MARLDIPAPGASRRASIDDAVDLTRRPAFQQLVRERNQFAWTLSIAMLVVYLGFIGLVAFAPETMAIKVGGGEMSLGIVLGFSVIVVAFLLTGIYVVRANGRFDDLTRRLTGERSS